MTRPYYAEVKSPLGHWSPQRFPSKPDTKTCNNRVYLKRADGGMRLIRGIEEIKSGHEDLCLDRLVAEYGFRPEQPALDQDPRAITMDGPELHALAQEVFKFAIQDSSYQGESVMEGGSDGHFLETATGPDLLRAAAGYFSSQM